MEADNFDTEIEKACAPPCFVLSSLHLVVSRHCSAVQLVKNVLVFTSSRLSAMGAVTSEKRDAASALQTDDMGNGCAT